MSLFGRKPQATPVPGANPANNPGAPTRSSRQNSTSVPHSRKSEHATEAPRGIDSNFCYGEEQD
jgi:hypothetical protein